MNSAYKPAMISVKALNNTLIILPGSQKKGLYGIRCHLVINQ
jgi:hypothetical protein